jgi:hypothetical protein
MLLLDGAKEYNVKIKPKREVAPDEAVAAQGEKTGGQESQDAQAWQGHDAILRQRHFEEAKRSEEEVIVTEQLDQPQSCY